MNGEKLVSFIFLQIKNSPRARRWNPHYQMFQQLPWPQNPGAFYICMDQLPPVSQEDANLLISQIASEMETGVSFPNKT